MSTTRDRPRLHPWYTVPPEVARVLGVDSGRVERDMAATQALGPDAITEATLRAQLRDNNMRPEVKDWKVARLVRERAKEMYRYQLGSECEFSDEAASDDEPVTIQEFAQPIPMYPKGAVPKKSQHKFEKGSESLHATPSSSSKKAPPPVTSQYQPRLTPLMKRALLKDLDLAGHTLSEAELKENGLDDPNLSPENRMWRLARMSRERAKTKLLQIEGSEWEYSDAALSDDETVTIDYLVQPAQRYKRGTAPKRPAVLESGKKKKANKKKKKRRSPAFSPITNTQTTPTAIDNDALIASAFPANESDARAAFFPGHTFQGTDADYNAFMKSVEAYTKAMKDDQGRHKVDDGGLPEEDRYEMYLRKVTGVPKRTAAQSANSAPDSTLELVDDSLRGRQAGKITSQGDVKQQTTSSTPAPVSDQPTAIVTSKSTHIPSTNEAGILDCVGMPEWAREKALEAARAMDRMGNESWDQAMERYGLNDKNVSGSERAKRLNSMLVERRKALVSLEGTDAYNNSKFDITLEDMMRLQPEDSGIPPRARATQGGKQRNHASPPIKAKTQLEAKCTCPHLRPSNKPSQSQRRKVPPPAPLITEPLYDDKEYPSSPASSSSSLLSNLSHEEQFYCNLVRSIRDEANRRGSTLAKQFDLQLLAIFTMAYQSSPCPPAITACLGGEPVCRCCDYAYANTGIHFVHLIKSFSDPRQIKDGMWGLTPLQVEAIRGIVFVRFIAGWYDFEKDHLDMQTHRIDPQYTGKGKSKCG